MAKFTMRLLAVPAVGDFFNYFMHTPTFNTNRLKAKSFKSDVWLFLKRGETETHLSIKYKDSETSPSKLPKQFFDFENANWCEFRSNIINNIADIDISSPANIDLCCTRLAEIIINARNNSVPVKVVKSAPDTFSTKTSKLIGLKNKIARNIGRTRDPTIQQQLKSHLTNAKKLLSESININRNDNWARFIKATSESTNKFWAAAKKVRNKNSAFPALIVNNLTKSEAL